MTLGVEQRMRSGRNILKLLQNTAKPTFFHALQPRKLNFSTIANHRLSPFWPATGPKSKNQLLFDNLFQFIEIENNPLAQSFISAIKSPDKNAAGTKQLLDAVEANNPHAEIFHHADCDLYILHAMYKEKLSPAHGITVYSYLTALKQFSGKNQSLHYADEQLQMPAEISVDKLAEDGKITAQGEKYLQKVCARFEKLNYELNYEELTQFILTLAPIDQWLLTIKLSTTNPNNSGIHGMMKLVSDTVPFIQQTNLHNTTEYQKPFPAVINYFLSKISPHPLVSQPIFGVISQTQLLKLYDEGKYPVQLYTSRINNNLTTIHGYPCGPTPTEDHDYGHGFMGSMLTEDEKKIISECFVPLFTKLLNESLQVGDTEVAKRLQTILDNIRDDFNNLTPIDRYAVSDRRVGQYIASAFTYNHDLEYGYLYYSKYHPKTVLYEPIGKCVEDRIFFLINRTYLSASLSPDEKSAWQQFIKLIKSQAGCEFRNSEVIWALEKLAHHAAGIATDNPNNHLDNSIDWKAWLDLLDTTHDSETLWTKAIQNHRNELVSLNMNYFVGENSGMAFFHPYLPWTDEIQAQVKAFVQHKIQKIELHHDENQQSPTVRFGKY